VIKAIETTYKGYRFRSRLEARWAVFFDSLHLKWEYEPEGFETPHGWYLPDFLLPELNGTGTWVEVKPDAAGANHPDAAKWMALGEGSGRPILIAAGTPDLKEYEVYDHSILEKFGGGAWVDACFNSKYLYPRLHDGAPRLYWCPGSTDDADCETAVNAARSARFEHGEGR
jgi:hypothetical protein